jgi:hypothetical protein
MNNVYKSYTDEEWLDLGKADAWAGRTKQSPEHNSLAASMYDLGYSEGQVKRSPTNRGHGSKSTPNQQLDRN